MTFSDPELNRPPEPSAGQPFDRETFLLKTWPEALESGEFTQGAGQLFDPNEMTHCCLGVACVLLTRAGLIQPEEWRPDDDGLPASAGRLLGLTSFGDYLNRDDDEDIPDLATDNDNGGDFKGIAETIRRATRENLWQAPAPDREDDDA